MRHKRLISSAGDACSQRLRQPHIAPRVQLLLPSEVAGPSRPSLPRSLPAATHPPPIPAPPIPPALDHPAHNHHLLAASPSSLSSASASSSSSSSPPRAATLASNNTRVHSSSALSPRPPSFRHSTQHPLSFLYPPSCLELTRFSSLGPHSRHQLARSKSSLAPTRAVSAAAASAAAAARQLASAHDHSEQQQHLSSHLDEEFSFLRHHYDPPNLLVHHSRSNALLRQDADSHLEDEPPLKSEALETSAPPAPAKSAASAPSRSAPATHSLASLRQDCRALRTSLQTGTSINHAALVAQCRRLVLRAHRISAKLDAKLACAIASETAADCAVYLVASGQPIAASQILRHLLVKLGWSPRSIADMESPLRTLETAGSARNQPPAPMAKAATEPPTLPRLMFVTQQTIAQLTLAPSASSPRPVRGFQSQHHLDAAVSLVAAMHLTHMSTTTLSQTALMRAMLASGHTRLAVHTYAAEVRAWWKANREASRPRSLMRYQAALIADTGKPSSQVLRDITRALLRNEELLTRIRADLWAELSLSERRALRAKQVEYAECLVDLLRLVRHGRLPLPPIASAPEITWIISACCRFETTVMLDEPALSHVSTLEPSDAAQRRRLESAASVIRHYMREYITSLPDGQSHTNSGILLGGTRAVRPAVNVAIYNQLIHYALSVLKSPPICKEVFQHMTQQRQPPLQPDAVTFNTILRQATTQRYQSLARAVLTTRPADTAHAPAAGDPSGRVTSTAAAEARRAEASSTATEARAPRHIVQQIDAAIAQADSYRLAALLQYVTSTGLFLRRYRHEPGHIGVKAFIMRIYPALNKRRHTFRPADDPEAEFSSTPSGSGSDLRPKVNQASRHAILDPHVLTAALNLACKAGKTGLALRVWRLLKRTSLQSALQSPAVDVASAPWKVPVQAATVLMQTLASEAARAPTVGPSLRLRRLRQVSATRRAATRRQLRMAERKEYARGWNLLASVRGRSPSRRLQAPSRMDAAAERSEGLRWRAAQFVAKREYAFLVQHWQLARRLGSWRRQRLQAWLEHRSKAPAVAPRSTLLTEDGGRLEVVPDTRFYDALLCIFGRRPGMVQRSKQHISRSTALAQLRRGFEQAASKAALPDGPDAAARCETSDVPALPSRAALSPSVGAGSDAGGLTTHEMLGAVVSRVRWNAHGRWTALSLEPLLVRILLDMEALGLAIPVGFRWVLPHCELAATRERAAAQMLHNTRPRSAHEYAPAFARFRGPRRKTVGLVASRPNAARTARLAKAKAE